MNRRIVVPAIALLLLSPALAAAACDPPDEGQAQSAYEWLRSQMPEWLLNTSFLLENWQWLALFAIAFVGVLVDRVIVILLQFLTQRALHRGKIEVDPKLTRTGMRPFGLLAMGSLWWLGMACVWPEGEVPDIVAVAVKFVAAFAGVWAAYRLVDLAGEIVMKKAERTATKLDDLLVPLVRKTLKVFIAAIGLVFIASNLDVDVSSLLAGLGLGGLAFALAAQDTVKNLFGSLTVLLDRPFQVGDWVVIGNTEGTVAEVGFRSTRLRTFYNSLVTIPNAALLGANVDNMGARKYRRWKTMVSVTYDTPPDKIEAFCEGIRELVRIHPYTRKDYFHVYLNEFADSSLNILLYVFHETPDWSTELRERHRLFLDIVRLAHRLGVEFAFPTRTLYMNQAPADPSAPPPHPTATQVSEAEVLGRREARAISDGTLQGRKPPPVGVDTPAPEAPPDKHGEGEGAGEA